MTRPPLHRDVKRTLQMAGDTLAFLVVIIFAVGIGLAIFEHFGGI